MRNPGAIAGFVLTSVLLGGSPSLAENRVALAIGNSAYQSLAPVANAASDADAMAEFLGTAGFQGIVSSNLTQTDFRRTLRDFTAQVAAKGPDTIVMVFYSGHSVHVAGENYLLPVDARVEREADAVLEGVRLSDLMNVLAAAPGKTRIIVLDAARNNPVPSLRSGLGAGLSIVTAPKGWLVAYSSAPGSEIRDGGTKSPFTSALVAAGKTPGLSIDELLKIVRGVVHEATEGRQTPWESFALTTDFAFFAAADKLAATSAPPPRAKPAGYWRKELQSRSAADAFELVLGEDTPEGYREFLALFPTSLLAPRVRSMLDRRVEMVALSNALASNTVAAFDGFLSRYPNSDWVPTARRLRESASPAGLTLASRPPPAATEPPAAEKPKSESAAKPPPEPKPKRAASEPRSAAAAREPTRPTFIPAGCTSYMIENGRRCCVLSDPNMAHRIIC